MQQFREILFVVSPGSDDAAALERAVTLAENNQARLTVVDVMDMVEHIPASTPLVDGIPVYDEIQAAMKAEREQLLQVLVEPFRRRIDLQTRVLAGKSVVAVVRDVLQNRRDLVVKTADSGGPLSRLFGSEDMYLLRKCPCPVWLVKPQAPRRYRRILAAVDVNDQYPPEELATRQALNRRILEIASSLAVADFGELHIVYVWKAIGESTLRGPLMSTPEDKISAYVEAERRRHAEALERELNEMFRGLPRDALEFVKPQSHLVKGQVRREVPALAAEIDADAVVMGTVARVGIPGFFIGNTAETILNRLKCSVLAIKPPGFESPVSEES